MKIILGLLVFLACLLAQPNLMGADKKAAKTQPPQTVKDDFANLKTALYDGNGNEAASRVTKESVDFYGKCSKLALDSRGVDLESLDIMECFLILHMRYKFDKTSLMKMNGHSAFIASLQKGLIKKDVLRPYELNLVTYEGDQATAGLLRMGKQVNDAVFTFQFEEGVWKFDMIRFLKNSGRALDAMRKRAGKSKLETALALLERTYDQKMPAAIRDGPLK